MVPGRLCLPTLRGRLPPAPWFRNSVYLGEHYDARLELGGWDTGAKKGNWKPAVVTDGPTGKLRAQMQPPIRVTRVGKAVKITEPKPGVFIADLGQNFAGVARIQVKGPAGTKVTLRYGEEISSAMGRLNVMATCGYTQSNEKAPNKARLK